MDIHKKYMKRCLELAQKGFGRVSPNPMVGCVIVYHDKIIGEGYHQKFGEAHAEVNAINSVKMQNIASLRDATIYVNLEPCSHFGKTSPCTNLIINSGIKYIVIGNIDTNPIVKGKGIQQLLQAGCDVKIGIMDDECKEINKRFFTFHEKKRPYILLKYAQTQDGFMANGKCRIQISGDSAIKLVHQWRSEEQSIIVGTNTALIDNPELTVRKIKGKNPIRIVLDREKKIPLSFHLLDGSVPTIIFTAKKKSASKNIDYITIDFRKDVLKQIMNELYKRQIQSLIVEGGAKILNSFLQKNLWDEARVFTNKKTLLEITGTKINGIKSPGIKAQKFSREKIGNDELEIYRHFT
ncbi:MAG: bifunctional diaminohydroxyphosphoribosylaminopyrimidine deaminase/5-amino-6-(5-phosphoribosylamino)uracil reductase RibD [Bacteroidota bacterium]